MVVVVVVVVIDILHVIYLQDQFFDVNPIMVLVWQ